MVIDSDVGCNRSIDLTNFLLNQYDNSFDFTVFPCAFIFVDSFILFRLPSYLISLWMEPKEDLHLHKHRISSRIKTRFLIFKKHFFVRITKCKYNSLILLHM